MTSTPVSDLISVIVLNHNKAAYSKACLHSVLASTHRPLEVVAVDNGSADDTRQVLEDFAAVAPEADVQVQLAFNDTNVGAITGRNQALERARGSYFVFLDNDVVVGSRDWLQSLRAPLDEDPTVGIVSAKLLFPWAPFDIEFAGCGVSPTGRVKYLGRGEPRDTPEFCRRRELQCAISACFMFRRALVDEIGPLDEVFNPVQYEDLDFCYRARSHGYKVLLEPAAELYHYEHTTTDGSVDINFKYVTIKNGLTFKKRWESMFSAEQGPADDETTWRDLPRQTVEACPPPKPH